MKKFTEIGQLRNVIHAVKHNHDYNGKDENGDAIFQHSTPYPKLKFKGTVKIHGTNSGICKYINDLGEVYYEFQSRERVLSLTSDNAGFMIGMLSKDYQKLFDGIEFSKSCVVYGEWSGSGIQKGVAIAELPKMFIIFAVRIDDVYQNMTNFKHLMINDQQIYNILQFKTYEVQIDFNQPEIAQNKIVELTLEVEDECPVGKYFGISGLGGGIVFSCGDGDNRYTFKSKGLKHSNSKVKIIHEVDTERITALRELAEKVTPSWRLSQMLTEACDLLNGGYVDRTKLGNYIKMVIADVVKEDSDIIINSGFEFKDVTKYISEIAKLYFFEEEYKNL